MKDVIEVGSYKKFPHIAMVGTPQSFYLWVDEDGTQGVFTCASEWIKGREAFKLYHKLRILYHKDKKQFCEEVRVLHEQYKRVCSNK